MLLASSQFAHFPCHISSKDAQVSLQFFFVYVTPTQTSPHPLNREWETFTGFIIPRITFLTLVLFSISGYSPKEICSTFLETPQSVLWMGSLFSFSWFEISKIVSCSRFKFEVKILISMNICFELLISKLHVPNLLQYFISKMLRD